MRRAPHGFPFQTSLNKYLSARNAYQSCLSQSCQNPPPPPPPPPSPGTSTLTVSGVSSLDPNDKEGPSGTQAQRYVSGWVGLVYLISFGNEALATAPAQQVRITDFVDPTKFDLSTASLGPITFSGQVVWTRPRHYSPLEHFSTQVDLRPTVNLLVNVTASLNSITDIFTWTLQSIDPNTGQPPTDPVAGFLPPGTGGCLLSKRKRNESISDGKSSNQRRNQWFRFKSIYTDFRLVKYHRRHRPNEQGVPPAGIAGIAGLSGQWSGSDVGAGIQDFTIYVSDNGAPYAVADNHSRRSSNIHWRAGPYLRFYSIARDLVGNVDAAKTDGRGHDHYSPSYGLDDYQLPSCERAATQGIRRPDLHRRSRQPQDGVRLSDGHADRPGPV